MKKLLFISLLFVAFLQKSQAQKISFGIYSGCFTGVELTTSVKNFDFSISIDPEKNKGASILYFLPRNENTDLYVFVSNGPEGWYKSIGIEYTWETKPGTFIIWNTDFELYSIKSFENKIDILSLIKVGLIFEIPTDLWPKD